MAAKQESLFPHLDTARYGDNRRKRPLFIPSRLSKEAQDKRLKNEAQQKAYEIILKWTDLESSGKLSKTHETGIEGEFLTQIFGEALGYTLFSENKDHWNLKPKFNVNGGIADAAIGMFSSKQNRPPRAVIELKGSTVNVDHDKFNGRTPVQQCWDYLNALPECPWGIVCNFVSFRLYHRRQTPRVYELFTLQELRDENRFREFYWLFHHDGLLPPGLGQPPHADWLLEDTATRQKQVGDELYEDYHDNRILLIQHLCSDAHNKSLEDAIRIAQKLIDRIVFVAFCEDRGLLPANSIYKAWSQVTPFYRVTNPKWQNFLDLFDSIDKGNEANDISPYNGGLFRRDDQVDSLDLDDEWTNFFKGIGDYDFRFEINTDILGHLFEKSINDIERVRLGGLFESEDSPQLAPKMKKSAERKKGGIYYTPPEFTEFITNNTVGKIAQQKIDAIADKFDINPQDTDLSKHDGKVTKFCHEATEALRQIKVVDPACGSGAFLIQAYDVLEDKYLDLIDILRYKNAKQAEKLRDQIPDFILHDNLFGVDLSPEAVEIAQLSLWLRSAHRGKSLADLSKNIICGNSLVSDPEVDPYAMDFKQVFQDVFTREKSGFDCVIGNPPWERMKMQEREFFDTIMPNIASSVSAAKRRILIAKLEKTHPEIHQRYLKAKTATEQTLDYVRQCDRFPLTAKGDINTYQLFAELARTIVSPTGLVGILVPSGIATDKTTKDFFAELVSSNSLIGLYDFENRQKIFPDVDGRYKFSILLFSGVKTNCEQVDFVFFAHQMEELKDKNRHISLSAKDFNLLNPNTKTCPVFRSKQDAEITKAIYQRVPVLIDRNRKEGGNPWGIKFFTMFHQTNDAELFHTDVQLKALRCKREGPIWKKGKKTYLPLYEAKMIQMYDHRAASIIVHDSNWMRQGQTDATTPAQHQNPEFTVEPRWWVEEGNIVSAIGQKLTAGFISYKDVTSATNQRTMIAAFIPKSAVLNSAPLLLFDVPISYGLQSCLLANLNAICFDFVARQKVGGLHLNFFIVEQFPVFSPDFYSQRCPWSKRQTLEKWISDRVLKLTCTSNDMIPLA
ncbi:MAG: N-6 DNA methylase, partial [Syntrophaceae bacterium]|nr:N-6 DNA methylase [Syntrophaceae bacterium]